MQNTQAPAAPQADPGFRLPGSASAPADPVPKSSNASGQAQMEVAPAPPPPVVDTSTRDLAIGSVAFVVLLIAFFFARNAYVHHLVVRRVAPSSAGSAGWLLFLGLAFLSAAAVLAIINASKFLTFAVTGPLVIVAVIALIASLLVGRR